MLRLSDKLLATLLSLMLGLAPLQGVMGMTGGSPDQQTVDQQTTHSHVNGKPMSIHMAKPAACPHCLSHDCCQGHQGHSTSSHCSGCAAALPVAISLIGTSSGRFTYPLTKFRYTNRLPATILRPPKA